MIKKENLINRAGVENSYEIEVEVDAVKIKIGLDPDDVELDETISLGNKVLMDFKKYEANARKKILEEFFDNYNDNWIDEDHPKLNQEQFEANLTLSGINILSNESVDFFYSENGMFGHHSLIAQSFDGESFKDAIMYG